MINVRRLAAVDLAFLGPKIHLIALGINVPLLLHAVGIVRHGNPGAEIAEEADDRSQLFRKYRRQSLWLLVPLVVAIVAVLQVRRTGVNS